MKQLIIALVALIAAVSLGSCQDAVKPPAKEISPARIYTLTTAEFLAKIGDITATPWKLLYDKPVIIDFYADWCGPCKMLEPHLWTLAHEYYGKVEIFSVDIEADKALAAQWGIEYLPALYFIPKTGAPKLHIGYRPTDELRELIEKELMNK